MPFQSPRSEPSSRCLDASTDVEDVKNEDDLMEQTAEEYLDASKAPIFQPHVTYNGPLMCVPTVTGVGYADYELGDVVTVAASRGAAGGFGYFTQDFRVIGRKVMVDRAMNEEVELTLDQATE